LVASHDVAEREENAAEEDDSEKEADEVPAFENSFAAAFSVACHGIALSG
jgi:hypothetical protein